MAAQVEVILLYLLLREREVTLPAARVNAAVLIRQDLLPTLQDPAAAAVGPIRLPAAAAAADPTRRQAAAAVEALQAEGAENVNT